MRAAGLALAIGAAAALWGALAWLLVLLARTLGALS